VTPDAARAEAGAALPRAGFLREELPGAFAPRPALYWLDVLASAAAGWGALLYAASRPAGSLAWLLGAAIATLGLYRAALFIHELAHLKPGACPGLETAWNLLVGFPLLVPSLMYVRSHLEHHSRAIYGTPADPEYEAIASWSPLHIAAASLGLVALPPLLWLRWAVLGPLSRLAGGPLRRLVVERLSTLVINADYRRPPPRGRERLRWGLEEAGAAAGAWALAALLASREAPLRAALLFYLVSSGILLLNQLRTLAAHRYEGRGAVLTREDELRDSVTLTGPAWIAAPLAPVGLRYHALHHLFPALPYHSLGAVHRLLHAKLPPDSAYRETYARSLLGAVGGLLRRARARAG